MQGKYDTHDRSHEDLASDGVSPRTLLELVAVRAALVPDAPALVAADGGELTYHALHQHMLAAGRSLRIAGVGPTDTVATVLKGGPAAAATFLAVGAHCVCAPLNPAYTARELEFYLEDLGARTVVIETDVATDARRVALARGITVAELVLGAGSIAGGIVPQPPNGLAGDNDLVVADNNALVLHTSGTTARPKIVPLSHARLTTSASTVASTLNLGEGDRCLNVMPLFHIHGLVAGLIAPLLAGGSVICPPSFDAARFVAWLETLEPTWFTAVPTMHQAILARLRNQKSPRARHTLRFARSSSAPLPLAVIEGLEQELGVPVIEAYGMTEAAHQIASNPLPPGQRRPGTVGVASGLEVAILDEDGTEVGIGRVGEVAIRGDSVFAGYADNPEANSSAFVGGWFRTGDLGILDGEGYLELRGRIKEIINRGGEKIAPEEIDQLLLRHPAVAQSVTFGVPDTRLGEDVAAAVVLATGQETDERELQYFAAQTLAPFKVPRRIVFLEEIPKGPTGKVQRIGMAGKLGLARAIAGSVNGYVPPRSPLEAELARIWSEVLGITPVGRNDDFFALGGDSLLGAEAVARVRDLLGRSNLPLISIVRAPTPAGMVDEITYEDDADEVLVKLRSDGPGQPLFLTHGGDLIVGLPALASRLNVDRPVYGLRPSLAAPQSPSARLTIEGIAAELVTAVRAAEPRGPYVLAGVCSGGPIVLEMARQMTSGGDEVAMLVLIDPRVGSRRRPTYLARRLLSHARRGSLLAALREKVPGPLTTAPADGRASRLTRARDTYVVRPLHGTRVTLLTSKDYFRRFSLPSGVWREALPDGFAARTIPFPHDTLMFPPTIEALASALDDAIGVDQA